MNILGLIYILAAHYFAGRGLLELFKAELKPVPLFCLSMMTGVPLLSFAPCFVQLLHIPITGLPVFISVTLISAALSVPLILNFKRPSLPKLTLPKLHELPFWVVILPLMAFSVWRCFYYPPYSRDMLSGPELLAEFAVREGNMISSVFNVDLHTSNNYFKSPYITGLQIIYKLLVNSFGQIWLSILFVSFTAWLYTLLKERVHSVVACTLLLLFLFIPEVFAYTFLMLYDYSNMIFFFTGLYFLQQYFDNGKQRELMFAALLFGLATYIRTETLVLIVMLAPLPVFHLYMKKTPAVKMLMNLGIFLLVPAAFYYTCIHVFVALFVPLPFELASQINPDLKDIHFFLERIQNMNSELIFCMKGVDYYGYFIFIFLGVLVLDIFQPGKFNHTAKTALYGIAVVYVGMGFLGYLIPHVDLDNTTKRGLFKAFPLMLLYMSNSLSLQRVSSGLKKWEDAAELKKQ